MICSQQFERRDPGSEQAIINIIHDCLLPMYLPMDTGDLASLLVRTEWQCVWLQQDGAVAGMHHERLIRRLMMMTALS